MALVSTDFGAILFIGFNGVAGWYSLRRYTALIGAV